MSAPSDTVRLDKIIGKNQCNLTETATSTGVDLIWYDSENHNFLFWGPELCVIEAMKIVREL